MTYKYENGNPTIVLISPESTIDNIFTANPSGQTFKFAAGNYYITNILNISRPNVTFINTASDSRNVHIYQNNSSYDGLNVITNGFTMSYISVHVPYDNKIALIAASANNTTIKFCYFYGNSTGFTIYFAGPKTLTAGASTLNGYYTNNLDTGNIFTYNVVYSNWSGDCISFSLQLNGTFTYNIVRGGRVAIYMCKSTNVSSNTIYDSVTSGIDISLPSNSVTVRGNNIYQCFESGIKISNQLEHGTFVPTDYNILIDGNYIYDCSTNAIEFNDVQTSIVSNNTLISTDIYGMYLLRCKNLNIYNNKISYFVVGIWFEQSNLCNLHDNNFMSIYPGQGQNVIKFVTSNTNTISNNNIKGKIIYDLFSISSDSIGNNITNNPFYEFYSYSEELSNM